MHVRGTKTARSRRSVPVPLRASLAISKLPPRMDTRLLFPAPSGGPYALGASVGESSTGPSARPGYLSRRRRTRSGTRGSHGHSRPRFRRRTSPASPAPRSP
jgi:hypothetical protein